jgi:hypothetical protein
MSDISPPLDYKPELPQCLHHCIGIIGAGGIVDDAYLAPTKKLDSKSSALRIEITRMPSTPPRNS